MEDIKKELVDNASYGNDIKNFFDGFLKSGVVIREKEIVPGFTIKIKVLNTEELLLAESILSATNPNIPFDIIQKVRSASILAQAVVSLNGLSVEKDNVEKKENLVRRNELYKQILKMPALIIQKSYEFYLDAVKEQNALYENMEKTNEAIKNF